MVWLLRRIFVWLGVRVLVLYRRVRYGAGFRRVSLTQGKYAKVSPADYAWICGYNWRLVNTPGKRTCYAERGVRVGVNVYSRVLMHREIMDAPSGMVVDHANGDGLDNRRENLRLATRAQNAWNAGKRRTNRSGYKGVWYDKKKRKYRAAIYANGKRHYLGYFASAKEAARAYDRAARQLHKEFARLNFRSAESGRERSSTSLFSVIPSPLLRVLAFFVCVQKEDCG